MGQMIEDSDPRIAEGHARLDRYWAAVGFCEPTLLAYFVNPQFQGKPAWPNMRQDYRVVRTPTTVIISSDGLSDPFVRTDMDNQKGVGCEVYIETPDLATASIAELQTSWAFKLIENFAMNVADWAGLAQQIERHGVVSTEFDMRGTLPDTALTADGSAGFLVNLKPPGRVARIADMPFGAVDIVSLTLLPPRDLETLRAGGAAARKALAVARSVAGGHLSRL